MEPTPEEIECKRLDEEAEVRHKIARRRAEIMALAGAIATNECSNWPEIAKWAIELHAAIEAELAKEKTNEVIEEVLGHTNLKGN